MKKLFFLVWISGCLFSFSALAEETLGLKVGSLTPNFTAMNHLGEDVRLSDELKKGPVILIFYRGGWCPYCNRQLRDYQEHLSEIKSFGASVIAVSVDRTLMAERTVKDQDLGYTIISDPNAELLKKFNLLYMVPAETLDLYKTEYNIDLQAYSGRKDGVIAIPAIYVIDINGDIIFAHADRNYKVRKSAEDIIAVLKNHYKN